MLINPLTLFIALCVNVIVGGDLEVGDACVPTRNISDGKCVLVTDCEEALRDIRKYDRHQFERCGFESSMEVVCCPRRSQTGATSTKPLMKTTTASTPIDRYGTKDSRVAEKQCKKIVHETIPPLNVHIIGGEDAELGEFPHMVALGFLVREGEYDFRCGGSLVSEYYIVTAAHCVDNIQQVAPSIARLGVVEIGKTAFNPETDIEISDITNHPQHSSVFKYHDLSLLRLAKPAEYSVTLVPVCLYTSDTLPKEPLTVTGWGKISVTTLDPGVQLLILNTTLRNCFTVEIVDGDSATPYEPGKEIPHWYHDLRSNILKKANVTEVASSECDKSYTNWRKLPDGIRQGQFCAGDPQGRTDACTGDSGGPIQVLSPLDGHHRLIGITSFGRGCGSTVPGVYTKIYPYLDWIESVVWPNGI